MFKRISRLLVTIIIFLITIILFKSSKSFKNWYQKHVLDNKLSFTSIASKYESLFGSPIPFKNYIIKPVFDEKLKYSKIEKYENGYLLDVDNNLIPSITDGLVIYVGKKNDDACVIVEYEKVEFNYCKLKNIGVKLYDHVKKGTYIGEVDQKLYLIFMKSGEYLDYEDFI